MVDFRIGVISGVFWGGSFYGEQYREAYTYYILPLVWVWILYIMIYVKDNRRTMRE